MDVMRPAVEQLEAEVAREKAEQKRLRDAAKIAQADSVASEVAPPADADASADDGTDDDEEGEATLPAIGVHTAPPPRPTAQTLSKLRRAYHKEERSLDASMRQLREL